MVHVPNGAAKATFAVPESCRQHLRLPYRTMFSLSKRDRHVKYPISRVSVAAGDLAWSQHKNRPLSWRRKEDDFAVFNDMTERGVSICLWQKTAHESDHQR